MKNSIITAVVLTLGAFGAFAAWAAADPPASDRQMAILLVNGQVLHGEVADEGDRVLIKLGPGSQVRLPRGRVAATAESLAGLYQAQRRRLRRDDIAGHVELARWCQRQDLTRQAGEMLVAVTAIAPDDPQVKALEQQLRRSLKAHAPPTAARSNLPAHPVVAPPNEPRPVSPEALTQFTQHIQPMLNNHCGASGCHGVAGKSDFAFIRPLQGGIWTQRLTQRNLQSTLAQVNFTNAAESRLFLAATLPHAGADSPILTSPHDDRSLEALRDWILAVGAADSPQLADDKNPLPSADAEVPSEDVPPTHTPPTTPPLSLARPSNKPAQFTPRDPLDPEIFNRQFFPGRFEEKP